MDMTSIMAIWNMVPVYVQVAIAAIGGVVTFANAITMATPSKVDDEKWGVAAPILNGILNVLNVLAGNIFKNKNADAVEPAKETDVK